MPQGTMTSGESPEMAMTLKVLLPSRMALQMVALSAQMAPP